MNLSNKHCQAYCSHKNFLPPSDNTNTLTLVKQTALGIYFSLNVLDTDFEELKKHMGAITQVI